MTILMTISLIIAVLFGFIAFITLALSLICGAPLVFIVSSILWLECFLFNEYANKGNILYFILGIIIFIILSLVFIRQLFLN